MSSRALFAALRRLVVSALVVTLVSAGGLLASCFLGACHPEDFDPLVRQPKLKPYGATSPLGSGAAMREPPPGALPRERELEAEAPAVTKELLTLGRAKFDVHCAACHGLAGDSSTPVASKMNLRAPPSLHEARLRALSGDEIYHVVTEGYGLMPRFSPRLSTHERWAVVAYVRALQTSQSLPIAEAPVAVQRELGGAQ